MEKETKRLKIYCDTNLFVSYHKKESNRLRPISFFAFDFFSRGWNCYYDLIISDWLLKELKNQLTSGEIDDIINEFKKRNKLIFIKEEKGDREKAKQISSHWQDPLHAILANKARADYLATSDKEGFSDCQKLVEISYPESI